MTETVSRDAGEASVDRPSTDRDDSGRFLPGNTAAVKHGVYAQHPAPAAIRQSSNELVEGIVSDLGGLDNLTAIQRGYIELLRDTNICRQLLVGHLIERGLFTPRHRVRSAYSKLLETIDRWDRLAMRLGTDRRAKQVPTIDEFAAHVLEHQR